jgi:hypothetical protein
VKACEIWILKTIPDMIGKSDLADERVTKPRPVAKVGNHRPKTRLPVPKLWMDGQRA